MRCDDGKTKPDWDSVRVVPFREKKHNAWSRSLIHDTRRLPSRVTIGFHNVSKSHFGLGLTCVTPLRNVAAYMSQYRLPLLSKLQYVPETRPIGRQLRFDC